MRLQINTTGAWRNLFDFATDLAAGVEDAAAALSRAAGGVNMAVLDDDGTRRYLNEWGVFRALREEVQ